MNAAADGDRPGAGSRLTAPGVLAVAGAALAGLALGFAVPDWRLPVLACCLIMLDLVGALYGIRAVRHSAFPLAWKLSSVGRSLSLAATLFALCGTVSGVPAWWWSSLGAHLGALLLLAAGAVVGPTAYMRGRRLLGYIAEVATVFGAGFMLLWYFVLHELMSPPDAGPQELIVGALAVGDLLIGLGVISIALSGGLTRAVNPTSIYTAGLALFAVAESIWLGLQLRGVKAGESPTASVVIVVASLLLTVSPMLVTNGWITPVTARVFARPSWSLHLPQVLAAGVCALLLAFTMRDTGPSLWGGLVAGLVIMAIGLMTRQYVALRELRAQVGLDSLTGLVNRAGLDAAAARAGLPYRCNALILVSLDGFKLLNEEYGHRAGDAVLVDVARRVRDTVRRDDICARLGGDEFAVLLAGISGEAEAEALAQRVVEVLAKSRIHIANDALTVKASVSLAIAPGTGREETVRDLLRSADVAMFHAKRDGTHGYVRHDPSMVDHRAEDAALSDDLSEALARGQLSVVYQPLVELSSGRAVGAEALLRWDHAERGPVSPARFIPLAERSGVINRIGLWVLEEACRQLRQWHSNTTCGPLPYVSVNLSPRQLHEATLVADVLAVLERTGLEPRHLVLEVTESSIVDQGGSIGKLRELRTHGIRIAIDDFGTGYSSLQYLTRLPANILKIDRSFVATLDGTSEGSAIAEAVLRLGQTLHLATIAEGIETMDQAIELKQLGCDIGQGYLYARPAPAAELTATMTTPAPLGDTVLTR